MIRNSKLWKKITRNKAFEDSYILAPDGFQSLWVFFNHNTADVTLQKYLDEGRSMCNKKGCWGSCEMLDKNDIIRVYGKKVIVFS